MRKEESRQIVEEKFRKYKESKLEGEVLKKRDQNCQWGVENPENQSDLAKMYVQENNGDVIDFMLNDPTIYALHENLKKEADEKNKQILITAFPKRYKDLLLKELALNKMEERVNKIQSEKEERNFQYIQKFEEMNKKLSLKNEQISILEQKVRNQITQKNEQFEQMIRKRDIEISQMQSYKHKYQKLKTDYKSNCKVMTQLRQSDQQKNKQIDRLVDKLKTLQQKLHKAHRTILDLKNQREIDLKNATKQIQSTVTQLQDQKNHLQQIVQALNIKIQFKESLIEMLQRQKQNFLEKYDEEVVQKYEEMQVVKKSYLDCLQNIRDLQQKLEEEEIRRENNEQVYAQEIQYYKNTVDKLGRSNAQIKIKEESLEKLLAIQRKTIQGLEEQVQQCTKNCQFLKQEEISLKSKIQVITCQNSKLQEQFKNLEVKYQQNLKIIQQLKNKLENSQKFINENQENISILKQKVAQWLSQCEQSKLNSELNKSKRIIQKLKTEIKDIGQRNRQESERQVKMYQRLNQQHNALKKKVILTNLT